MQTIQAWPSVTTHAAAHELTTAEHSIHCESLHEVFSHVLLHPPSQLRQNILHFPLPQQPKSPFRLQLYALVLTASNENMSNAKIITILFTEVNLLCMIMIPWSNMDLFDVAKKKRN
jgi:hypothetical protein